MVKTVQLRLATLSDIDSLQQLYCETIDATCSNGYNHEQLKAWKSGIKNTLRWKNAIENQYFLIATSGSLHLGFGSLKGGDYIDFL